MPHRNLNRKRNVPVVRHNQRHWPTLHRLICFLTINTIGQNQKRLQKRGLFVWDGTQASRSNRFVPFYRYRWTTPQYPPKAGRVALLRQHKTIKAWLEKPRRESWLFCYRDFPHTLEMTFTLKAQFRKGKASPHSPFRILHFSVLKPHLLPTENCQPKN